MFPNFCIIAIINPIQSKNDEISTIKEIMVEKMRDFVGEKLCQTNCWPNIKNIPTMKASHYS